VATIENHGARAATERREDSRLLRRLMLGVMLVGIAGLMAELLLLEHYDGVWQWIPLVCLGAGFVASAAVWLRPSRGAVRVLRALSVVYIAAGALGVYLHMDGNIEFERELNASLTGLPLLVEALRGATPALAPGALAQLGLLGLVLAYRHPALRRVQND